MTPVHRKSEKIEKSHIFQVFIRNQIRLSNKAFCRNLRHWGLPNVYKINNTHTKIKSAVKLDTPVH